MGRKSLVFWLRLHWSCRLLWSVWTFSQYQPFESTDTDVFLCICVAFPVRLVSASYFSLQGSFLLVFFSFFGYCFPFPSFHCCYVEALLTLACFGSCPQSHDAHLLNCCFVVDSWELSKYRLTSTPCPVFYFSMPPVFLYIDRDLFFFKIYQFFVCHGSQSWFAVVADCISCISFFSLVLCLVHFSWVCLFLRRTTFHFANGSYFSLLLLWSLLFSFYWLWDSALSCRFLSFRYNNRSLLPQFI